jgi:hypothetical protein
VQGICQILAHVLRIEVASLTHLMGIRNIIPKDEGFILVLVRDAVNEPSLTICDVNGLSPKYINHREAVRPCLVKYQYRKAQNG